MHRFFSAFFLTAALLGVTPAGHADQAPAPSSRPMPPQSSAAAPQAPSQMPFLARQILESQSSPQEARPQAPPDRSVEQDIAETRAGIEQQRRESRENRDKARSRAEKGWGDITGPAR